VLCHMPCRGRGLRARAGTSCVPQASGKGGRDSSVLYCTVHLCTALYRSVPYCTVLYCNVLYCAVLCGIVVKWLVYLL